MSNSRCKVGLNCTSSHDGELYVPALSLQHHPFMLLSKIEGYSMAMAFSLWSPELWWIKYFTTEKYGDWSSTDYRSF